jgi:hypothetical protein
LATVTATSKVKRTLGSSVVVSGAVVTPWSTGTITALGAHNPFTIVVSSSPGVSIRIETGGGKHSGVPVDAPLHEDENNHVNKEGRRESNHRKELEEEVELFTKVDSVETLEASTGKHLNDTKDNTELHLERVEEKKLVLGHMPHRIKTEWVDGFSRTVFSNLGSNGTGFDSVLVLAFEFPAGSENVETEGKHIVVNTTSVDGEETHHDNHVTTHVHTSRHLTEATFVVLLLVVDKEETGTEQKETVTNISVHNSEEEWESGSRKEGRVGLPITWNTVGVDKLLVTVGKLVCHEMGRRGRPWLRDMVNEGRHCHIHVSVGLVDGDTDIIDTVSDNPTFTTEHTRNVVLELVEGVIDGLFAEDQPSPLFSALGEDLAKTEAGVLILEEDSAGVDKFLGVLGQHTVDSRGVVHVRERVTVGIESITDLLELGLDRKRLVEDDEDTLLDKKSVGWVGDRLLDRSETNVAVTTGGTEDHTLETSLFFGGNNSSDAGETHVHVAGGGTTFGLKEVVGTITRASVAVSSGSELGNSKTRGISHEETTGLLKYFLEFNLLVVLSGELLGVGVEFLELRFVSLKFHLHTFKELTTGFVTGSTGWGCEETVNGTSRFQCKFELVALIGKETKLALQLIATLHKGNVTTLKGRQVGVQLQGKNKKKIREHHCLTDTRCPGVRTPCDIFGQ